METVTRTILFTDLVGSVRMYSRVSDTVAAGLVRTLDQRVEKLLPALNGVFIKSTGDGQLLVFEEPSQADRCGLAIHEVCQQMASADQQTVSVRIAAHTGPVIFENGDVRGNTVNLAARLLTVAGRDETCFSQEAWAGLSPTDRAAFSPEGPEIFKGFTRYTLVYKRASAIPIDFTVRSTEQDIAIAQLGNAPRSPRYVLELDHPGVKKTWEISEGETATIGRSPECTVQVADRLFSGTHAALAVVDGILWCFDLGSTNGIFHGEERIKRRMPLVASEVLTFPAGVVRVSLPA